MNSRRHECGSVVRVLASVVRVLAWGQVYSFIPVCTLGFVFVKS